MRLFLLSTIILCLFSFNLKATHGLPIVNLTYTVSSTGVTISGQSDPATGGSGPYWMQVEVSTSPMMSGTPPATLQTILASWPCTGGGTTFNSYPWYNSTLNVPDLCNDGFSVEAYNNVFVPFSNLLCGNVYYFSAREWVSASNSPGPWSTPTSFTVPGVPGSDLSFSFNTFQDTICSYDTVALFPVNIVNGPITNYTWSNGAGITSTVNVSPNVTTTYSLTASNGGSCPHSETVTIHVIPGSNASFIPTNPIICTGDNIIFSAVGSTSLSSHYWNFNPNTGYTVNNSTVTPTPDVNFNSSGSYVVAHTITSQGCSYTATTNVLVNVCTSVKEEFESSFSIYPNPSINGIYSISYPANLKGKLDIEVYDVVGKLIYAKQSLSENEIQIKQSSGVYVLKISNEQQKQYFKKIVIE